LPYHERRLFQVGKLALVAQRQVNVLLDPVQQARRVRQALDHFVALPLGHVAEGRLGRVGHIEARVERLVLRVVRMRQVARAGHAVVGEGAHASPRTASQISPARWAFSASAASRFGPYSAEKPSDTFAARLASISRFFWIASASE